MSKKIHGFLLWPYQVLQFIAYRLVGVPCRYEFGSFGVELLKPTTRAQYLAGKLFPALVVGLAWILQLVSVIYLARLYQARIPFIPILFVLLTTPPLALYFHYIRFDWRQKRQPFSQNKASPQRERD